MRSLVFLINKVFGNISRDLRNSYLLTYSPPAIRDAKWRTIQLTAKGWGKSNRP